VESSHKGLRSQNRFTLRRRRWR